MAATHLTARFCAAAQPKTGKFGKPEQTAFYDDDPRGLELRVSGDGRKVWSFRYRTLEGHQRRITLGSYVAEDEQNDAEAPLPDGAPKPLTLKAARIKARQARAVVEAGGDPASDKRAAKAKALAEPLKTFNDLADAFITASEKGHWKPRRKQKRARTIEDEKAVLRRYVRPVIGQHRLETVDRRAIRKLLTDLIDRGIGAQTNRTLAVIRQVLAYGVDQERLEANAATRIDKPATETPRVRILTDAELKALWGICVDCPAKMHLPPKEGDEGGVRVYAGKPMRLALRLAMLLLSRRTEIAAMQVAEINLAQGTWLIPSDRMKGGLAHLVPLPPKAAELIKEAIELAKDEKVPSPFVFPSGRDRSKAINPDRLSHAMADLSAVLGISGATVHDLRRTGSTAMTSERLGISPFIRSRILAHAGDTGGGAAVSSTHYDANSYIAEKRRALEAWEGLLLEIVGERVRPPNLTALHGVNG